MTIWINDNGLNDNDNTFGTELLLPEANSGAKVLIKFVDLNE